MTKPDLKSDTQFKEADNNINNHKNFKGGNLMKKLTSLFISCSVALVLAVPQVYAGGLGSMMAKGLVGAFVGGLVDDAGRVASAGADKAQQALNGGQYSTYIEGDLDADIYNKVERVETGPNAFVNAGSVTISHSRFNDDVEFDIKNKIGRINAEDDSFVDLGSISFTRTRVNGDTDISITNKIPSGIKAGSNSMVTVGAFRSN
ncbi:hypothetical protein [Desulfonema limicola]|nr:hypothetical protein [Desulfonema limicola]